MSSEKRCKSKDDLKWFGQGDQYGACVMNGEPIICTGISLKETEATFEEARRFMEKFIAEHNSGTVGLYAGILTLGIGSVVAIVNTNIKIRALKREFVVEKECYKTSLFRLYSIGYRVAKRSGSESFVLERCGEIWSGRIF